MHQLTSTRLKYIQKTEQASKEIGRIIFFIQDQQVVQKFTKNTATSATKLPFVWQNNGRKCSWIIRVGGVLLDCKQKRTRKKKWQNEFLWNWNTSFLQVDHVVRKQHSGNFNSFYFENAITVSFVNGIRNISWFNCSGLHHCSPRSFPHQTHWYCCACRSQEVPPRLCRRSLAARRYCHAQSSSNSLQQIGCGWLAEQRPLTGCSQEWVLIGCFEKPMKIGHQE